MELFKLDGPTTLPMPHLATPGSGDDWGSQQEHVLSSLTHDLRAPLCAIMGYLDLVGRQVGKSAPPKAAEYLSLARQASQRMQQMVNNLQDMFHLENRQAPLELQPLRVSGLFQGVRDTFQGLTKIKKIRLVCTPPKKLVVSADPRYLPRVLDNLVANAIKFTPPGGSIQVLAKQDETWTHFEVADTGRGIAPEHQACIFEKFRQVRSMDRQQGYGMGLAVVRSILEAHGGQIRVISQLGHGSRFLFQIPNSKS